MSSQIEQVKQAVDIVALIGERVKLTRAGKNYKGLCPFHSEKSPSFFVTPDLGRYKCFGCQESGDAFTFLMKMDSISFAVALADLAKRSGIVLDSIPYTQVDTHRERLLSLLSLAKEYFHYLLTSHAVGATARAYIQERGITKQTIDDFSLGYAPESWDGLQKYLIGKKGFTQDELFDAGLIVRNERGRVYDRFRDRLMFPLQTARGVVVGFSGRLLQKDAKSAKYINSPETSLYHKSDLLFGYSQLSSYIRKKNEVIVCEGEFDVLSSLQANVPHVVAIKGSALTVSQVKFLSHTVLRILLALDADDAGIEATKRAIAVVRESGADILLRVIPLIGGKDPDDIARNDPKLWRSMVAGSVSVFEYLIDVAFTRHDAKTGEGKREITKELAPLLSSIDHAVERAHYVSQVARGLSCSEETLLAEIRKVHIHAPMQKTQNGPVQKTPALRKDIIASYILVFLFAVYIHDQPKLAGFLQMAKELKLHLPWKAIFDALYAQRASSDMRAVIDSLPQEYSEMVTTIYLQADEFSPKLLTQDEFVRTLEEYQECLSKEEQAARIERLSVLESMENRTQAQQEELEEIQHLLVQKQ